MRISTRLTSARAAPAAPKSRISPSTAVNVLLIFFQTFRHEPATANRVKLESHSAQWHAPSPQPCSPRRASTPSLAMIGAITSAASVMPTGLASGALSLTRACYELLTMVSSGACAADLTPAT